jgi:glycosyltransferase involved in cell wall biosynthesis
VLTEIDWHRWRRYQVRTWTRFDLVQTFTERDAEAVAELVPALRGRTRVSPFGIDVPPAADPRRQVRGGLLFAGSLTHYPNVDAALWLAEGVLPLLLARRPEAFLTIVGPHPPPEIAALDGGHVRVVGRVPDVRPFIERAQVVLAPVRTGGGMRMKTLEAMALGKAVVTTPRGAEGLTLGGRKPPLVVADGAQAIADAAAELMEDDGARASLGASARAFVEEHYGRAAYARRLEDVYREALRVTARGANGPPA